ncbi:MAG: orotate phosphoribosyltransferase [Terriglobales bacterium]
MSDRERLLALLARKSFRLGTFQLSAGGTSDYYVDCRTTTLDAEGAGLVGRVFLSALRQADHPVEAVGGLTLGADPIAVSVAVQSTHTPPPVSAFLVRKVEKTHGTARRIEGTVRPRMRVAVVDDVCTTAASTIAALDAAWEARLEVVSILCLVEREEAGGRARLEQHWLQHQPGPCPFTALYTARQVRAVHEAQIAAGEHAAALPEGLR